MARCLFLIDGAAGTGKTDMVRFIREEHARGKRATIVPKFTTRAERSDDKKSPHATDLRFISRDEFYERLDHVGFFNYQYGDDLYGFYLDDILDALNEYENAFLIVRDRVTMELLYKAVSGYRVITVLIYSDLSHIQRRLRTDGYSHDEINFRLKRHKILYQDYLRHGLFYDEVILNFSTKADFHRLVDQLVQKYTRPVQDALEVATGETFPLLHSLVGYKSEMVEKLKEFPYEKNVFVMMKFRKENRIVYDFIADNLRSHGLNPVRADDFVWNITNNVYNPVAVLYCCKYGIALFDEAEDGNTYSPNVAYELGMMHLQRKKCLILRNGKLPHVPFDLIKDLHKSYEKDLEMRQLVASWIAEVGFHGRG